MLNTASYFLTTSYRDALPINDSDRRYSIIFSRFQTKEAIRKFNDENPSYFDELFRTLEHAGALRKAFLEHTISADFNPQSHAPDTAAKQEMVMYAKSDERSALDEILAESGRRYDP